MFYSTATIGLFLIASVAAVPSSSWLDVRSIRLDNGDTSVDVTTTGPRERSVVEEGGPLMARQSDINCKGSMFCELLGGSCDDAKRKVIATNQYSTFHGAENTGTCSGTCGLFFSGDHCEGSGQELIDAYDAIRNTGHCTHCGQYVRDTDGCKIKIDRVAGCS